MKTMGCLAILLTAMTLAGCSDQEKEKPQEPPRPVLSMVIKSEKRPVLGFTGTVEAKFTTDLGFRVLGRITARNVDVGDIVTKGMELARLDTTALALAVRSAEADLTTATAQADYARLTEQRQQTLMMTATTSKERLEEAIQQREAADAAVTQANASLDKAREQLGYAALVSDTDGIVSSVSAEVGQVVPVGQSVVSVARLDVREAVVDIPEAETGLLKPATRYIVNLQSDPRLTAVGTLREVSPQTDSATRTRRVKITLQNPPDSFRLGSMITAVPDRDAPEQIRVPVAALVERDGQTFVWTVDKTTATVQRRPVVPGKRDTLSIEIREGLADGMRVVTAGASSLADGQVVKVPDEVSP